MKRIIPTVAFAAFCLLAAPAAHAGQGSIQLTSGFSIGGLIGDILDIFGIGSNHGSNPGSGGQSHSAPGPEAGIGIPILLTAGGYLWLVRRNRKNKAKRDRA